MEEADTLRINPGFRETVLHEAVRSPRYKDYRQLWYLAPTYNYVGRVPIHLDLEVTARCQLRCPGCPSVKLKYSKGDMPLKLAMTAMAEHSRNGGMSVKFNWRGEPTLYKWLWNCVTAAHNLGYVDIMFNTNGVALNKDMSINLIRAGLTTIAWSIDATSEPRYSKLRPGATLQRVLRNLEAFCAVAEHHDDLYIRVQRIEYPDEKMPHDEFVRFFAERFPRVNAVASNAYKEKDTNVRWKNIPSEPCAQPWQRIVIAYDGKMGPCCEFNRFGTPFGVYPKDSIVSVWQTTVAELREYHWTGNQNELEACRKCTMTKCDRMEGAR